MTTFESAPKPSKLFGCQSAFWPASSKQPIWALRKAAELILAAPAICTIGTRSSAATAFYLTAALNQLFGNATPRSLWVSEVTSFDCGECLPGQWSWAFRSFVTRPRRSRSCATLARK